MLMPPLIASAVSADLGAPRHLGRSPEEGNERNVLRAVKLTSRLTALLVDGVPVWRMIEKGFLRSFGIETHDLDNGQVAVNLLASGANFNLIILDIMSPVQGGIENARQIRGMAILTKMIGTTAFLYDMEILDFLDAGVELVIEKPLLPAKLFLNLMELDGQI